MRNSNLKPKRNLSNPTADGILKKKRDTKDSPEKKETHQSESESESDGMEEQNDDDLSPPNLPTTRDYLQDTFLCLVKKRITWGTLEKEFTRITENKQPFSCVLISPVNENKKITSDHLCGVILSRINHLLQDKNIEIFNWEKSSKGGLRLYFPPHIPTSSLSFPPITFKKQGTFKCQILESVRKSIEVPSPIKPRPEKNDEPPQTFQVSLQNLPPSICEEKKLSTLAESLDALEIKQTYIREKDPKKNQTITFKTTYAIATFKTPPIQILNILNTRFKMGDKTISCKPLNFNPSCFPSANSLFPTNCNEKDLYGTDLLDWISRFNGRENEEPPESDDFQC
jgi:hypothetical protein